jgi:hypothetical protein
MFGRHPKIEVEFSLSPTMATVLDNLIRQDHSSRRFHILLERIESLMATFSQLSAAITAFTSRLDAKVDVILSSTAASNTALAGIAGDIAGLKALIEQLIQTGLTAEQQLIADQMIAGFDAVETRVDSAVAASETTATAAADIDALTPPVATP